MHTDINVLRNKISAKLARLSLRLMEAKVLANAIHEQRIEVAELEAELARMEGRIQ